MPLARLNTFLVVSGLVSLAATLTGSVRHAMGLEVPAAYVAIGVGAGVFFTVMLILRRRRLGEKGSPWLMRRVVYVLLLLPIILLFFVMSQGRGPLGLTFSLIGMACTSMAATHLMMLRREQGGKFAAWLLGATRR